MSESKKKKAASDKVNKTAQVKPAKPPREKKPKEPLVVFAIRLAEAERDEIHKAAGPRGATQFVRAVALAAAREDEGAFREVIKAARELR